MLTLVAADDVAELKMLLEALPVAVRLASGLMRQLSLSDPIYLAADAEVSRIVARIAVLMNRRHGPPADGERRAKSSPMRSKK